MLPVGFEPTISAGERPQTYDIDRAITGTGISTYNAHFKQRFFVYEHTTDFEFLGFVKSYYDSLCTL